MRPWLGPFGGSGASRCAAGALIVAHRQDGSRPEPAQAANGSKGAGRVGAIVGHAELRIGAAVREVLEAHVEASDLFRGIRYVVAWD